MQLQCGLSLFKNNMRAAETNPSQNYRVDAQRKYGDLSAEIRAGTPESIQVGRPPHNITNVLTWRRPQPAGNVAPKNPDPS